MNPIVALIALFGMYILAYRIHSPTTNASNESGPSIAATLQCLHSQIELYKIQHNQTPPPQSALWINLLCASDATGIKNITANTTYPLGPYIQAPQINPANNQSAVGTTPCPTIGWIYTVNGNDFTLQAVNTTGNGVLPY